MTAEDEALFIGDTDTLEVEFYEEIEDETTNKVEKRAFDTESIVVLLRDKYRKPRMIIYNKNSPLPEDISNFLSGLTQNCEIKTDQIYRVTTGFYEFDVTWIDEPFIYLEYRYLYEDKWRLARYGLELSYAVI